MLTKSWGPTVHYLDVDKVVGSNGTLITLMLTKSWGPTVQGAGFSTNFRSPRKTKKNGYNDVMVEGLPSKLYT